MCINDFVSFYDPDKLEENFILLKALEWRAIDDFIPLLTLTKTRIIKKGMAIRNRIYEMADQLSVYTRQSHHISKHHRKY